MGIAEQEHAELVRLCRAGRFDEACAFLVRHIGSVRGDLLRVPGAGEQPAGLTIKPHKACGFPPGAEGMAAARQPYVTRWWFDVDVR